MLLVLSCEEKHCNSEQGFTLVELMVATLIFAIGMLGLAALQGQGLRYNSNAYSRSQAVLMASDMADRIRASVDVGGLNATNYGAIVAAPLGAPASCVGVDCGPAAMALADRFEWLSMLNQVLPGATGTVTCSSSPAACTTSDTYTITVTWNGRFGPVVHSMSIRP